MTRRSNHISAYPILLALLSAALFGAATPAGKALLGDFSAFQLAGLLYLGAALAVLPVVLKSDSKQYPWRMNRANVIRLGGAILCGGILGPVFLLLGLKLASAASVSMWLNLELVATAVLGRLIFNDHLGKFGWFGVAGVLAAGCLLSAGEGTAGVWAGLLVALGCLCWGFDNHFTALIDGITPAQSTLWKGSVAGLFNLGLGLYLTPLAGSAGTIGLALLVGALAYGASITLYITSAQGLGATRAQMIFASAPFFGVVLSAAALGESISGVQFTAAAILIISLVFIFRDQHGHIHTHEVLIHEHTHRHDDLHHTHEHPDQPASQRHSHAHNHDSVTHAHPHWPDLHHRHSHG